jgi:hypothetical protein
MEQVLPGSREGLWEGGPSNIYTCEKKHGWDQDVNIIHIYQNYFKK